MALSHKYGHRDLVDFRVQIRFLFIVHSQPCIGRTTTHGVDAINEIADTFVQYQADNVASTTLDGSGAIHVMGQMATFTRKVPRVRMNIADLNEVGCVK